MNLHGLEYSEWRRVHEQAEPQHRHEEPSCRSEGGQHDALGQELPHQPQPAGTQRGANRELALASSGARHQQARDVSAGDQQYEAYRAKQDEQQRSRAPVQPLVQRHDIHGSVAQERRLHRNAGQQRGEFGPGLRDRDS